MQNVQYAIPISTICHPTPADQRIIHDSAPVFLNKRGAGPRCAEAFDVTAQAKAGASAGCCYTHTWHGRHEVAHVPGSATAQCKCDCTTAPTAPVIGRRHQAERACSFFSKGQARVATSMVIAAAVRRAMDSNQLAVSGGARLGGGGLTI